MITTVQSLIVLKVPKNKFNSSPVQPKSGRWIDFDVAGHKWI